MLDTDLVPNHWANFAEHLQYQLATLIDNELKYFVFDTAAAGQCPDNDEDALYEILSDMTEWKVHIKID